MKTRFAKLILSLIVLSVGLYAAFDQLLASHHPDNGKYLISIDQLVPRDGTNVRINTLDADEVAFPKELQHKLYAGQTVALEYTDHQVYYYRQDAQGQLTEIGPIRAEGASYGLLSSVIIAFYLGLILIVLALIGPVFRDLHVLQKQAKRFGKKPQPLPMGVATSSTIAPLAETFSRMSKQVASYVHAHKTLSQTISHEVRTPLARMRFALELEAQQQRSNYLEQMHQDLDEIELLATSYLTFARLDYLGQKTYKNFNLQRFTTTIAEGFNLYPHACVLTYGCTGETAQGDRQALKILCQNLITNAFRYAASEVRLITRATETHCEIVVEDDGPGLPEGVAIFSEFESQQSSGFGLGLFIVKQVALWHEAELLSGSSERLGGAKFTVRWRKQPQFI